MNPITRIMAMLGAFGSDGLNTSGRAVYPYALREKGHRGGRQPQYTKKGPGRRHVQGKTYNRFKRMKRVDI